MSPLDTDAIAARYYDEPDAFFPGERTVVIPRPAEVLRDIAALLAEVQAVDERHLRELADLDALRHEGTVTIARLRAALVECAAPYEALLMDAPSRTWIAPRVWEAIEKAAVAVRAVLSQENGT